MKQILSIASVACAGVLIGALALTWLTDQDRDPAPPAAADPGASSLLEDEAQENAAAQRLSAPNLDALTTQLDTARQERSELREALETVKQELARLEFEIRSHSATPSPERVEAANVESALNTDPNALDRETDLKVYVEAGLEARQAADILSRTGELEMERLYLRNRAIREGWFGSERYDSELEEVDQRLMILRNEIGDDSYDRYLYASGQNNRIAIQSVIQGSPAAQAGMKPGDVLNAYAGRPILSFQDLTAATTEGDLGGSVRVDVVRDDAPVALYVPRGPLGVRLVTVRRKP